MLPTPSGTLSPWLLHRFGCVHVINGYRTRSSVALPPVQRSYVFGDANHRTSGASSPQQPHIELHPVPLSRPASRYQPISSLTHPDVKCGSNPDSSAALGWTVAKPKKKQNKTETNYVISHQCLYLWFERQFPVSLIQYKGHLCVYFSVVKATLDWREKWPNWRPWSRCSRRI